jgi:hypothetical protein
MDLGLFRHDRTTMMAWFVVPLLVVLNVQYGLHVYCSYGEQRLARQEALARQLPALNRRVALATDVAAGFAVPSRTDAENAEALGAKMSDAADRGGFTIDSVQIDKGDPARAAKGIGAPPPGVRLTVKGEGNLSSIIKFAREVQGPQTLVVVADCRIRAQRLTPEPSYEAEFTFDCRAMDMASPRPAAAAAKGTAGKAAAHGKGTQP